MCVVQLQGENTMKCISCLYRKSIDLFTKCAGIPGRDRAGTSYYCGHPENCNPVPIIAKETTILDSCPVYQDFN
jgi:hypothetical protein